MQELVIGHCISPSGRHANSLRPEELEVEVLEAGFGQQDLYSVKGPGELATGLEERMTDPIKRAQLLELVRSVEQERTLLGVRVQIAVVSKRATRSGVETPPNWAEQ